MNNQNLFEYIRHLLMKRPSKEKQQTLNTIKAIVLPNKETVMIDEFSGYTKTRVQLQQAHPTDEENQDILEIYEPYYEGIIAGQKCLIVHESYEPLHIGEVYTFRLDQPGGQIVGVEQEPKTLYQTIETDALAENSLGGKILCHKVS